MIDPDFKAQYVNLVIVEYFLNTCMTGSKFAGMPSEFLKGIVIIHEINVYCPWVYFIVGGGARAFVGYSGALFRGFRERSDQQLQSQWRSGAKRV